MVAGKKYQTGQQEGQDCLVPILGVTEWSCRFGPKAEDLCGFTASADLNITTCGKWGVRD